MAIIRNYLQCSSCDSKIVVRVAPSPISTTQTHKFPCPGCGVEISFSLVQTIKNNLPKASFKKPLNARWIKDENGAIKTLTFDPDRVAPSDMTKAFSPWMAEFHKIPQRAHQAFGMEEDLRLSWRDREWPWIQKIIVHFNSRNKALFDKEAKIEKTSPSSASWATRLSLLYTVLENAFDNFTLNPKAPVARIHQRLSLAKAISPDLFDQLAKNYVTSSRMKKIWDELTKIRTSFLTHYPALAPLLRMQIYWTSADKNELSKFSLPDKKFDDLKQLYVDCYETLCRLAVIVVGIETTIHHKSLVIPTKGGASSMSLWDYEAMPNGNKHTILQQYPIHHLFVPFMDSKLRNGIGHHSAIYEPKTDEVVYYSHGEPTLVEKRMSYTEFAYKVLSIYSALELAALYFHSLHIRAVEMESWEER
jgi:hypothetical protein